MTKLLNRNTAELESCSAPNRILQFGEGNFLRAFVDWMIDIINEKTAFNSSVTIVQPIPNGMTDVLNKQDGLYHVLLEGIKDEKPHSEKRLITSVKEGINPYNNYEKYLKLGENPDLEFIFSNTTEAGIAFDKEDTSFEEIPNSFPAKLTALLYRRFRYFEGDPDKAPVIIPCELIDRNGDNLKNYVLKYGKLWELEEDFNHWIDEHCIFCNTLVDRIVPGYPSERADKLTSDIGFDDNLIVVGEYFHLWVIEAPKSLKKLIPFEEAGLNVVFVDDLTPYRTRKVRILNGLHTSMVPVGYLNGNRTVKEAVEDKVVGPYLGKELFEEIIPTLDLPDDELGDFSRDILSRFRNPYLNHELSAIALNSISKFKVRVLPSLIQFYEMNDELPDRLTFALAAMICFYKGQWKGTEIPLNDSEDVIDFIQKAWEKEDLQETVKTILAHSDFWDRNLNKISGLTQKTSDYISRMKKQGITSAIHSISE